MHAKKNLVNALEMILNSASGMHGACGLYIYIVLSYVVRRALRLRILRTVPRTHQITISSFTTLSPCSIVLFCLERHDPILNISCVIILLHFSSSCDRFHLEP